MKVVGKKYWIIPDCELPPEGEGELKGHESVVIVNDSNRIRKVIKPRIGSNAPAVIILSH